MNVRVLSNGVEVQHFGSSTVVNNVPDTIDPYDMLDCCDNVEREGEGSFRFDGVCDRKGLVRRLEGRAS